MRTPHFQCGSLKWHFFTRLKWIRKKRYGIENEGIVKNACQEFTSNLDLELEVPGSNPQDAVKYFE